MISPLKTITRKKEKASVLPQNVLLEDEGIHTKYSYALRVTTSLADNVPASQPYPPSLSPDEYEPC